MIAAALFFLAACAPAPQAAAPSSPAGGAVRGTIDMRLAVRRGSDAVAPGGVLRSGDAISLEVAVSQPAYLGIVQFFPDGTSAVLYPRPGEAQAQVAAGQVARIPPGETLMLDTSTGEENVYVVASATPLVDAGQSVETIVADVRASSGTSIEPAASEPPPALPEAPPPEPARAHRVHHAAGPAAPNVTSEATRGFQRMPSSDPAVEIWQDEEGVTVFRFAFRHE